MIESGLHTLSAACASWLMAYRAKAVCVSAILLCSLAFPCAGQACNGLSGVLLEQPPSGDEFSFPPNVWEAYSADAGSGSQRYERVDVPLGIQIDVIRVFGFYINWPEDGTVADCAAPNPAQGEEWTMTFEVSFYADNVGHPGDELCATVVDATPVYLPGVYGSYAPPLELLQIDIAFDAPCVSGPAWIRVEGVSDPEACRFFWITTDPFVDNLHTIGTVDQPGVFEHGGRDLALCVSGYCPLDVIGSEVSRAEQLLSQQAPEMDLAAPAGVLDMFDMAAYLALVEQGCP